MVDQHVKIWWNKKMKFFYRQFNSHLAEKEHQLLLEIQVKLELIKKLEFIAKEVPNFSSHSPQKLWQKELRLKIWMIELKFHKKCFSQGKMEPKIHTKDFYKELLKNSLKKLTELFWLHIEICQWADMNN